MREMAILIKALSHNIALCKYREIEIILFGKGIAFNKKRGDSISFLDADKIYQINDIKLLNAYEQLVSTVPEEIINVSEDIISMLIDRFGNQYNPKVHITLLDHLYFSLSRLKNKVEMQNIFGEETKFMYPKEYAFASEVVEMINKRLNVVLPPAEISFITLHIHAALDGEEIKVSTLITGVVAKCLDLIEAECDIKLNENSFLLQRLITHIKFAIKRSIDQVSIENPLAEVIQKEYPYSYQLARKLSRVVDKEFGFSFTEGEKAYLALHIENILKESQDL